METMNFLIPEISQGDLVTFSEERVNLKKVDAQRYRDQVSNLREDLERYIKSHPEFGIEKMLLSGSLAKGTALKTIRDADVAVYVNGGSAPQELAELLSWLVEKLRLTYPQIDPSKIYVDGPCVVIAFSGTGIKVEIAPVYSLGDPEGRGYLWDRSTGKKILTSIPRHLEFTRIRKEKQPIHYAQVIRLMKWWMRQREKDTNGFKLRSFLVELIVAKVADSGADFSDYHAGLENVFSYIQNTGLKERIAFNDYYKSTSLPKVRTGMVEIFDPVTPENNVAVDLTESNRINLVTFAGAALDSLCYARTCQTKSEALDCWRELMGQSFSA
jgi:tRNA nucleotidyltransferase (CCA-adding enzyme)